MDLRESKLAGSWRKYHDEEILLQILFCSINVNENEMGETCSTHSKIKNVWSVLEGKPERKMP